MSDAARLKQLEDVQAIATLKGRYVEAADGGSAREVEGASWTSRFTALPI